MSATLINGVEFAQRIKEEVAAGVRRLTDAGQGVRLTSILVGDDPGGQLYAKRQGDTCRAVGIDYELKSLSAGSTADDIAGIIRQLNADPSVSGIMLHLPLPDRLDATQLQSLIDPRKDVEGVNPANLGYLVCSHTLNAPCTALAAVELAKSTGVPLRGAEAVVVGVSPIVGMPAAILLISERATVTVCRSTTRDLKFHTSRADVLIVATGRPGMIGADHVRSGAVVIDVGINRVALPDGTKKTVGDVDFEAVRQKAGFLTPVPGGVGPVTVTMLLRNTLRSAEAQSRA